MYLQLHKGKIHSTFTDTDYFAWIYILAIVNTTVAKRKHRFAGSLSNYTFETFMAPCLNCFLKNTENMQRKTVYYIPVYIAGNLLYVVPLTSVHTHFLMSIRLM